MMHLLLTLLGIGLVGLTVPLVLELFLVTAANLVLKPPAGSPEQMDDPASLDRHGRGQVRPEPKLTIIVPAHNEELLVSRTVASLRLSAGPEISVLVVAHNCSDQTAARAEAAGAEALVYNDPTAVGKGFALRYGFAAALAREAGAVLVVDADSIVTPNTVPTVEEAFANGARVVQCRYQMESSTERSNTQLAALAYRAFNVIRPRGRQLLGLSAGILGNGFAISRTVLLAVPYDTFSVVEDLEYHLHLVMAGERVHYLNQAVISAHFPLSRAGEATQRSRWEGGRVQTARAWALPLLGKIFRGHPRLIEPLLDLTGLPLAFGAFALLIALALPLAWLRWYAALSLATVAVHVLTAAWAGPDFLKTLQLLALSPFYILRKLSMIPGVLRGSSAKAAWVPTERDNTL